MMKRSASSVDDKSPTELVDILDRCDGDLDAFAQEVAPGEPAVAVTTRAELVLADSAKDYLRWNQLIMARNQARFKLAQQKAYQAIGTYELPKNEDGKNPVAVATMIAFARFWCGAETTKQHTQARKDANATAPSGEIQMLEDLYEGLVEG